LRHHFYRYVLFGLIWTVILVLAVSAVRAGGAAQSLFEKARGSATQSDVLAYQRAGDFAKAFASEWATFGGDANEYARRLRAFNPALRFNAPTGCVQRAVSAYLLSLRKQNENTYEADVLLDVQRFVELPDADAVPEAYRLPASSSGAGKPKGWVDAQMVAQVVVREKEGKLYAPNIPVVVPKRTAPDEETRIDYSEYPSQNVSVALTNFVRAYFGGKTPAELANFTAPESRIAPVGGWEVKSVDSIVVDAADAPSRASVWVTVAQGGFVAQQHLYLNLKSEKGQVFVTKVSAEPN